MLVINRVKSTMAQLYNCM